jgi:hypothetical protein
MIMLSLNCIRLANPSKKLVIKIFMDTHNPSILFLQEIMMEGDGGIKTLSSSLLGWNFLATNAQGKSRGLIKGWKNNSLYIKNSQAI